MLSSYDIDRFSSHILLPEIGVEGQKKLKASRVLILGMGGLGSSAAVYLTRAGIGHLGLMDFDKVSVQTLQRQILFNQDDVGKDKANQGGDYLKKLDPSLGLETYCEKLTAKNALRIVRDFDVVLDCSDNFQTRYLINEACVQQKKPNVYGSIFRFEGQLSVFDSTVNVNGPCLRCFFPKPPVADQLPAYAETGVIGVLPGVIGILQATEAIKIILKIGQTLVGRVLVYDALRMRFREILLPKNPSCESCHSEVKQKGQVINASVNNTFTKNKIKPLQRGLSPQMLREKIALGGKKFRLLDVRSAAERQICNISGSEHLPFDDIAFAKKKYALDDTIVVFCKTGARSIRAKYQLEKMGFTHVDSLAGGILNWMRLVETGNSVTRSCADAQDDEAPLG